MRFHYAIQNGIKYKTYELFISGIFCLIFHTWQQLWVTNRTHRKQNHGYGRVGTKHFTLYSSVTLTAILWNRQGADIPCFHKRVTQLVCLFVLELGSCYIAQAILELPSSTILPPNSPQCSDYRCVPLLPSDHTAVTYRRNLAFGFLSSIFFAILNYPLGVYVWLQTTMFPID
jgi:hypothetical protein